MLVTVYTSTLLCKKKMYRISISNRRIFLATCATDPDNFIHRRYRIFEFDTQRSSLLCATKHVIHGEKQTL